MIHYIFKKLSLSMKFVIRLQLRQIHMFSSILEIMNSKTIPDVENGFPLPTLTQKSIFVV